jgi:hypothetical protein
MGNEFQVCSTDMDHETRPDLAWSGSAFGVVWNQSFMSERNVYISLLNEDGTTAVDDRALSEGFSSTFFPTILWTSSEWVVAWAGFQASGDQGYFLARVDASGSRLGDVVLVDDVDRLFEEPFPPLSLGLAPGLGLVLAWQKEILVARRDIYAAPYSFDLEPLAEPILVTSSGYSSSPALAWDGAGFGLVWINHDPESSDSPSVRFARIGCP